MNIVDKIDKIQRKHKFLAFPIAVIKKYSDDEAGYKAALLTYYMFLSLFPLLLVLTTLIGFVSQNNPELKTEIIAGAVDYLPVLGSQLAEHINGLHSAGPALVAGLLLMLYGARGVASALQHGVQHIWSVPSSLRPSFPESMLNNFKIIIIGGLGFIVTAVSVGLVSSAGHGLAFKLLAIALNLILLTTLFIFLINVCLPNHVKIKEIRLGAVSAAVGMVVLQIAGGYLLTREMARLDALYSYFALSLGLLFWLYLQAQVIFYAMEIATVSDKKYWPRSLNSANPTVADKIISKTTT